MAEADKLPSYDLRDLKVLVVDGNKHMRQLLKQILFIFAIRNQREADDVQGAFKEVKEFKPDIILTEYDLQPANGCEFVRMVRRAEDSPDPMVPIIMVTAYTETSVVGAARDSGINEFLAKPVSPARLYQRLVAVIDRPRPFVRCKSYVGPCRHRRKISDYDGPLRRQADGTTGDVFVIDDAEDDQAIKRLIG
jgi:DNA-binding response OmpR family regulator